MKTIFSLLAAMFLINLGHSQPVISNVEPEIGDTFLYTQAGYDSLPLGGAGANINWDFSNLTDSILSEYDENYLVVDPSEVEGNEDFSDATSVWFLENSVGTAHTFLSFENNEMVYEGVLSNNFGRNTHYDDTELNFAFPLAYQDSDSDTYSGHYLNPFNSVSSFSGTKSYVVDGYGTVETQYGVFTDVLRISTLIEEVEGISLFYGIWTYSTQTAWYSEDYSVPLLTISSQYHFSVDTESGDTIISSDTTFALSALTSYTGVSVGIAEQEVKSAIKIYPNPALDYISLDAEIKGTGILKIFGLDGKLVLKRHVHRNEKIDVNKLSSGYYIAILNADCAEFEPMPFVLCDAK